MDVPAGWIAFEGWEDPSYAADHAPVHIALNPAFVQAIQDIRDEPGTLIVMVGGPTYRTEAILAPAPQPVPAPSPEPVRAEPKRTATTSSSER